MTTLLVRYVCNVCGALEPTYKGQCAKCQHWDTFVPCEPTQGPGSSSVVRSDQPVAGYAVHRVKTGIVELDRTLCGGFVKGRSVALAGGEGGGKSTLLLQAGGGLARAGKRVLYVSGEEQIGAVQHRASRLGVSHAELLLTAAVEVSAIKAEIEANNPAVVFYDSLQTIYDAARFGDPGDLVQIKRVIKLLGPWCNARNLVSVFLCQLNADNKIAGPRFFRHMVDVTMQLSVEENGLRSLKVSKNRDGATEYQGRFRMTAKGLEAAK